MKERRLECKMTQQDVAKRLGITAQYYQQIEANQRQSELDFSLVVKLSSIFNIDMSKIAEFEKLNNSTR